MSKPLNLMNEGAYDHPNTVVIYWHPRQGPDAIQNGHAALIINSMRFKPNDVDDYVSWMGTQGGNPFKMRGKAQTFRDDMMEWGGAPAGQGMGNVPKHWVILQGLATGVMKTEWLNIRTKNHAHFRLFNKNCATVVARVLKAGGSDAYATRARNQLIWWPTDLITYARSMGNAVVAHSG